MHPDLLHGFYLGDFLIEPLTGSVMGPRASTHLQPKAAEVLVHLALNAGSLVSHEQLLEEVWGEGNGSREALSHAISAIRHALDDHADDPTFVQTLPRRGYRLIVHPQERSTRDPNEITGTPGESGIEKGGFLDTLKRRGVMDTAVAYSVLGWLIIQVADVVLEKFYFNPWASTFVTAVVITGFPIAVVLSWFLKFGGGREVIEKSSPRRELRRRVDKTYISIVGALSISVVVVYIYDQTIGLPRPSSDAPISMPVAVLPVHENSIAVLPFSNLDGSDDTQIFANGLAEDIISRMSRVPGLLVASRGDSFTLESNSSSQQIRDRLRVARYVEGSVQIEGPNMRVAFRLIDSATGFNEVSRTFDRKRGEFFAMRDEIMKLTVANILVALPAPMQVVSKLPSDNESLDAYVLYRRGVEASRMPRVIKNIESALNWFEAALQIDPGYAVAHAGKCQVYVSAYPVTDDPVYIELAEASCARALELNPNLDVVHAALGELYRGTGRYEQAKEMYLKALQIDAGSVVSLTGLGIIATQQDNPEDAEAWFRKAVGLHPGDWSAFNALGFFFYRSGRYAEAAEQYQFVVTLDNTNVVGYTNLGTALMLAGDFDAAAGALERALEIEPRAASYSNLGLVHYYRGQLNEAIDAHRNAVALAPKDHLAWSNLGDALWNAGDTQAAAEAFRTANELAVAALKVNPSNPAFVMDLAWISAMLGDMQRAQTFIAAARVQSPDDPYVYYIDGLILLKSGNEEAALRALETAVERGYSAILLKEEPHLAPLRSHPRFQAMVKSAESSRD